nr:HDOD domain-containing protein [uncultured Dethiosulfovibrio sp.]
MALIRVDKLKEGMVVKKDVTAPTGRFIMASGATIESRHLKLLKSWGVIEVEVEGDDEPDRMPQIPPMSRSDLTRGVAYLDHLFSICGRGTPVLKELSRAATIRVMNQIGQKGISVIPDLSSVGDEEKGKIEDLSRLSISSIVGKQTRLFSFSDTYRQIVEVLQSPKSSATHIAQVVEKDTSLSAKLLQIVNSAYYGFPSKIGSIQRAVTILGGRELTTLAIGITAIRYFAKLSQDVLDMERFWRNSVACGVFARLLAGEKRLPSDNHFFLAGLLRDIGLLLLIGECPVAVESVIRRSCREKVSLPLCEREVFGFSHAFLGASLLAEWKVPAYLVNIVKYKDNPLFSSEDLESSILHVADCLSFATGYGWSPIMPIPAMDDEGWNKLDLSHNVLEPMCSRAERQISEIVDVFLK